MLNLENTEAQEYNKLLSLSNKMGKDKNIIQGSGGNTSIKIKNTLFVKASGMMLEKALEKDIFIPIDLNHIYDQIQNKKNFSEDLEIKSNQITKLKPSIETALHAIMPHKVVLHCHSIDAIAYSLCKELLEKLDILLKNFSWEFIKYERPGLPLANLIKRKIKEKKVDILLLANHGLIVGADTVMNAEIIQNKILNILKIYPRLPKSPDFKKLKKISNIIPNSKLPQHEIIHSLATDKLSLNLVKMNPPYPDHVVFCGKKALILDFNNPIEKDLKSFDYCIIPRTGVLILREESNILETMLEMEAKLFLRLEEKSTISLLSDSQCEELINWEAEKYRQKLLKI